MQKKFNCGGLILGAVLLLLGVINEGNSAPQLQQSGGGGSTTSIVQGGNTAAVSAGGALKTDASATTQPVSGTVTANQGGAPWSQNLTQVNGVTLLAGNGVTGNGSPRVTIASDQTPFTINAAQSGTWNATINAALPAGTNLIGTVKQIPMHGCSGSTLQDITSVDVATGGGTAATAADTCVFYIYANNKTGSPVNLTIQDKSGTPIVYSTTFSIPANSDVRRDFGGHKFLGGVQLIAGTGSALNVVTYGVQ